MEPERGTGTIESAIRKTLRENGHEVVSVGRTSGDAQADICEPSSLRKLFAGIDRFEAVANAAGDVFPAAGTLRYTGSGSGNT